jgi:hypothetical protein
MKPEPKLSWRPRRWTSMALAAFVALAMTGVGFSTMASAGTPSIEAPCEQVAAVLSDGPDPGVDPVGYAQAQILQLRKLKLSGHRLGRAVLDLAAAYAGYARSDGTNRSAKVTVKRSEKAVNAICPGAAQ